jgi:hypothetical protein
VAALAAVLDLRLEDVAASCGAANCGMAGGTSDSALIA